MARLAILIPDLRGGGAERVALTLAEGFVERGHEVDLLLMQARGELMHLLPQAVRIVDLKSNRIRQAIRPLARYLRAERPTGLIAMMWPMPVIAVIARFVARSTTRVIASDHAILSDQYQGGAFNLAAAKLTTRLFYPLADRRVAASTGIADDLSGLSGISKDRIEAVPNPISMPPGRIYTDRAVELRWGNGARILSVGNLKAAKNYRLLLEAFALLIRRREASLIILGEGEQRAELEACASRLGISDHVVMPGFRTNPWPYYASADLFALSSVTEGFGNVIVEAMAVGLPVVSTDCAGPREILCNGKFGRLVPIGDADGMAEAMELSLAETADRERLKARAFEFRPERAVERYLELAESAGGKVLPDQEGPCR